MDLLLTTKLHIPQLSADLVSRPHLYERLDEGLTRKLTLVSAPAGFGKSSLVTGWLTEKSHPVAWLSLDQGDNDPIRFWSYFIAAIQTIHPEIGLEARQIISTPQLRSTEPVAISLINDLSQLRQEVIMVLDDYHVIEVGQVHSTLSYMLEHQPLNLHIVLITRVDPSISLARLRAHSQLVEIRAENLQFSTQEATTLFNEKMGLNLKPKHVEALILHTESWVVGLRLAALSLKGQSSYDTFIEEFTGSHHFILDYLIEEVLDMLPEAQRGFLLRTSILERFNGNLCRAVTGDLSSGLMLEEIRKGNLFLIPLDTHGRWFRYHHLFAEVLYALLVRDHPGEIDALHLKAASWFESEGFPGEAVDHAFRSGHLPKASELILRHWLPFIHRGEIATILRWLDALPEEMKADDPSLALAHCWALFLSWQNSAIGPHLEQATNAYERLVSMGSLSSAQQGLIAAQLAMMRSVLARERGEHTVSVAHAEEATRLLQADQLEGIGAAWNMLAAARAGAGDFNGAIQAYERGIANSYSEGNLIGAYGCTYGQVMYMLLQGRLNEAEKICRTSIEHAIREGHGDFPATGWLYIAMARIKLERYQMDEAEAYVRDGLRIARLGGFSEAVRSGRYLRAHLAAARGDLEAATDIFEDTARIVNATGEPYLIGELNGQWLSLCIKAGDLAAAREKLYNLEEKIGMTQHANLLIWWRSMYPRLLYTEERYKEALTALEVSIHQARSENGKGELIRLLVLQAVILDALGDHSLAQSVLREALALGAPEGYVWRWLEAGARIGPLLGDLRSDHDTPQKFLPYLNSLLDACRVVFEEITPSQPGELPDALTLRELEVMRLICKGYSNPEIANELVVTINTIKKHTSNIYSKLGVRSRTQAIARAQQLNLF